MRCCGYAGLLLLLMRSGSPPAVAQDAKAAVVDMVAHEDEAEKHRDHYEYLSFERSERTGGHLWMEKVAETSAGKLHYLIAEDGKPLAGERLQAERDRMAEIAAHPEAFQQKSQALKDDEAHAKSLLYILPRAFVFENLRRDGEYLRLDFHPDPAFSPHSMEEKVLHGMTGSLLIEPEKLRLRQVDARLPQDVGIGFGLLATIKAGSNFQTTRMPVYGEEWKTKSLDTDINGHAIFFKAIGKQEHAEHRDFKVLPGDLSVPQAVALLEQ